MKVTVDKREMEKDTIWCVTDKGWYTKEFYEAGVKVQNRENGRMAFYLFATDEQREQLGRKLEQRREWGEDNRKWAWIKIGNTKKLCWVDNKNMKAYKTNGYEKTWIEIKHFTFIRWATGFDL